jgi:hypothetical protein
LDIAPPGESHTVITIVDVDKPKKITMQDGCYFIPKNLSKKNKVRYKDALIKAGFVERSEVLNREDAKRIRVEQFYEYEMQHPDHGADNIIEGNFAIMIDDETVQLQLVSGRIKVKDLAIHAELKRQGFAEIGKVETDPPEVKEDEEEDPTANADPVADDGDGKAEAEGVSPIDENSSVETEGSEEESEEATEDEDLPEVPGDSVEEEEIPPLPEEELDEDDIDDMTEEEPTE